MKYKLKSFYTTSPVGIDDENVIFILDSNVLASLYLFEDDSFDSLSHVMKENKDKFWIPYNVALEYQRNRINQIKLDYLVRGAIEESFDKCYKNIESLIVFIDRKKSKKYKGIIDGLNEILKESKERKSAFLSEQSMLLPSPTKDDYFNDKIRCVIDDVFDGRVGDPYDQERLNLIYSEGAGRYEKKIPPGFKDENKEEQAFYYNGIEHKNRYGDLIIWKQTLDYIKSIEGEKTVIFVTNDLKDDWWYKLNDIKIPHYYLKGEVFSANPNVEFELISADDFFRILVDSSSQSTTPDELYSDISRVSEMSSLVDDIDDNSPSGPLYCHDYDKDFVENYNAYLEHIKKQSEEMINFKLLNSLSFLREYKANKKSQETEIKGSESEILSEMNLINRVLKEKMENENPLPLSRYLELSKRKKKLNERLRALKLDDNDDNIDDLLN